MGYYNKLKKILSYINFLFGIYIWLLIIYAFFRMTGLITRIPMQEHGLGYYLSLPIETILKILFKLSTLSIFNLNPSIFNKVDWTI